MKNSTNPSAKRSAIKLAIVAAISLLLLIPLSMVMIVIDERDSTKDSVTYDIARSYADKQTVYAPSLESVIVIKPATDSTKMVTSTVHSECPRLNYNAEVTTDILHRSIYDVIVYNSPIDIRGSIKVNEHALRALTNTIRFKVSDFKGIANIPQLHLSGETYPMTKRHDELIAKVKLPDGVKIGDEVEFNISFNLKGTESLSFQPQANLTTLNVSSPYPHPCFMGEFLPTHREVRADGFVAEWQVSSLNVGSISDMMCVKFVDPANNYQQAMRSAKYGMLIIILVFMASLFVEYFTRREIAIVQYVIIGVSLVLFYSLLLAFSEIVSFGVAYLIAAVMTIGALILYFRAILKGRSAYLLGGFVATVYAINYILLQMESYTLLAGSLVLFALLCGVMYFTANLNGITKTSKTE